MTREIFFRGSLIADMSLLGTDAPADSPKPKAAPKRRPRREPCGICGGSKEIAGLINGKPGTAPCPFCRRNKGRVRRYGTAAKVAIMKARKR